MKKRKLLSENFELYYRVRAISLIATIFWILGILILIAFNQNLYNWFMELSKFKAIAFAFSFHFMIHGAISVLFRMDGGVIQSRSFALIKLFAVAVKPPKTMKPGTRIGLKPFRSGIFSMIIGSIMLLVPFITITITPK